MFEMLSQYVSLSFRKLAEKSLAITTSIAYTC